MQTMMAFGRRRQARPVPPPIYGPEGELMLIGELARRCGLSTQSIRFYEREGLITPGRAGTFRVYGENDKRRLETILALRRMGVSIVRIREFLGLMAGSPEADKDKLLGDFLASHLDELKRRQEALIQEIAATSSALDKLELPSP